MGNQWEKEKQTGEANAKKKGGKRTITRGRVVKRKQEKRQEKQAPSKCARSTVTETGGGGKQLGRPQDDGEGSTKVMTVEKGRECGWRRITQEAEEIETCEGNGEGGWY